MQRTCSSSNGRYALHTQMRDGSGRFLVEDIEVARYDAEDVTEQWQWNGVLYFYYVNAAGYFYPPSPPTITPSLPG